VDRMLLHGGKFVYLKVYAAIRKKDALFSTAS